MNGLKYLLDTFNIFAYNKGSYKEKLKSKISSLYGSENVYTTLNGRTAIYLFLKSLSLSSGSQVAVQAFTCNAVINPILANNLEPLYIDITEGSYNMSLEDLNEKITDNTKVLILQHTFGVL
ncbi:DegT/DnrJ/EryC1/StrS aminotransferase family protein, partial [bacterium]|nr:DegT/DnrJ/EryC1/StrS aminotransferase family protein [bacterium]